MYIDSVFRSVYIVSPPLACFCHGLDYIGMSQTVYGVVQSTLYFLRHIWGRCGGFDGYVYSEIFQSYLRLELRQENYLRRQKILRHVQHDCWRIDLSQLNGVPLYTKQPNTSLLTCAILQSFILTKNAKYTQTSKQSHILKIQLHSLHFSDEKK